MEGVRLATEDDISEITTLVTAARAELAPTRGGDLFLAREARPDPIEPGLRALLKGADCRLLAGTIDDTIIGYAAGRVEVLRDARRLGVIDDLFVESEARSVGVGEAMMGDLLAWFRDKGCMGVDATALPGNRATKNFFEGSGFTARLLVMHHRFTDPDPAAGAPPTDTGADA
jgi:GNAT superfamily N-acetyltransferase